MKKQNTTPAKSENWYFRAYDGNDNILEEREIMDRTEDEARRECESYVEQSQTIEDWTLTPTPPQAGNELPQRLDVHSTGLLEHKAEIHPANDPDGEIIIADVFQYDHAVELVRRYNQYPELEARNRELVEALRNVIEMCGTLRNIAVSMGQASPYYNELSNSITEIYNSALESSK
jgi:hypothetical protein